SPGASPSSPSSELNTGGPNPVPAGDASTNKKAGSQLFLISPGFDKSSLEPLPKLQPLAEKEARMLALLPSPRRGTNKRQEHVNVSRTLEALLSPQCEGPTKGDFFGPGGSHLAQ